MEGSVEIETKLLTTEWTLLETIPADETAVYPTTPLHRIVALYPGAKDGDANAWIEWALAPKRADQELCLPMQIQANDVRKILDLSYHTFADDYVLVSWGTRATREGESEVSHLKSSRVTREWYA